MKAVKIVTILIFVYLGIIVAFESLLGYFQPANQSTLVITTTAGNGVANGRVVARLESDGRLYVAANHWPRAWYKQASENPQVQVNLGGETAAYLAVPVTGQEHDRINSENRLGLGFRILTGFPPRYFYRLDPASASAED
jgi:hypothetical protein